MLDRTFPPHEFLWGVATSAYQSEGGYNGPGEPQTNWAAAEARRDVAALGRASDFWRNYEADFARCREMCLNAFRMGVEWSRVQPGDASSNVPPPFDCQALDHYVKILSACRRNGMEPVLTLHHFVHPAWLGSDPWLNTATPSLFAGFVSMAVSYLNRELVQRHGMPPIRYYLTINEPNTLAINTYLGNQFPGEAPRGISSFMRACNQILRAHILAYNTIHDLHEANGWDKPAVSLNNYCTDLYWTDKIFLDMLSLREACAERADAGAFIERKIQEFNAELKAAKIPMRKDTAAFLGGILKRIFDWSGERIFKIDAFSPLLDTIYASPRARLFDFVALDYYDPFVAHMLRFPVLWDHEFKNKTFRSWLEASIISKWWDWHVLPHGLRFFSQYYSRDLGGRNVLIAENGMALRRRPDNQFSLRKDHFTRSKFLKLHVREVAKIVKSGVPLIGYLHWSLFDNYEWGSFTPRFGLLSIDYTRDRGRLVEDHLGDRPSETYAKLICEARKKME